MDPAEVIQTAEKIADACTELFVPDSGDEVECIGGYAFFVLPQVNKPMNGEPAVSCAGAFSGGNPATLIHLLEIHTRALFDHLDASGITNAVRKINSIALETLTERAESNDDDDASDN